MNVYKHCPSFENEEFILRQTSDEDVLPLLAVYSDEKSVPLFNSDNCHGDNFHYTTEQRMRQAVEFWKQAYDNGWFVRWSVIDKSNMQAVGTIEEFKRDAEDYFTDCGLIRLDLKSEYENTRQLEKILSLIAAPSFDTFGCSIIATKAVPAASARRNALIKLGFTLSAEKLIGHDGTEYGDYFVLKK